MNNNPYNYSDWKKYISNIDEVIKQMEEQNIVAVGVTPHSRIIPSFFLENYSIFTLKRSSDVETLEKYVKVAVLEDSEPNLVNRIHGTTHILNTRTFQAFLSTKKNPKIMFYTITQNIINLLNKRNIPWIGNAPESFEEVRLKGSFRNLLNKLGLPFIPSHIFERKDFLSKPFDFYQKLCKGSFVVQRSDKEVSNKQGTYFIRNENDFLYCSKDFEVEGIFDGVLVSPFIEGDSSSMLGCVTQKGTLSGPLQVQLIDIKESLNGIKAAGTFYGNDLKFKSWGKDIQDDAKIAVEKIGKYLGDKGYKGIFGLDFVYDKKKNKIFTIECNPRFTGSLSLYSLALLHSKIPPLEFFHLISQLNIDCDYDFEKVNEALKIEVPFSHITFSPDRILKMGLPLEAGIYFFDDKKDELVFRRPGISLDDIKDEKEFLLIDIVPKQGQLVEQGAAKFFRFFFPYSIALSSNEIEKRSAFLVERFAKTLVLYSKSDA